MRLSLVLLVSVLGLAVAQPALADGGRRPGLDTLVASCKAKASGDGWKDCVKSQLPQGGRLDGPGMRAGKLKELVAACKAKTSGDGWKDCVKLQLGARDGGSEGSVDPGHAAEALCKSELGQKLGDGCVSRLSSLVGSCKAASSGDGWKDCLRSQLPKPQLPKPMPPQQQPGAVGLDPMRFAQSLCQGPLGVKLGEGCVTKLTAALASCKSQTQTGGEAFKACVTAQLPIETRTK